MSPLWVPGWSAPVLHIILGGIGLQRVEPGEHALIAFPGRRLVGL
jgi:hypothetical protein